MQNCVCTEFAPLHKAIAARGWKTGFREILGRERRCFSEAMSHTLNARLRRGTADLMSAWQNKLAATASDCRILNL